jgi:hypothetical protein
VTAVAFALIVGGLLLVWSGLTDTPLRPTLTAVLTGKKPPAKAKP